MDYTISITLTVTADDEYDAYKEFIDMVKNDNYDSDSIDIEEESEEDY